MNSMTAALRRYADFEGRSSRTEYWMFTLLNVLVVTGLFVLALIGDLTMSNYASSPVPIIIVIAVFGWMLYTFIPGIAVTIRRLHDTNTSGWMMLLQLIPLGGFVIFVFTLLESTPGPNRYGPNPHDPVAAATRASVFD